MGFGAYLKTKDFWRQILWMILITALLIAATLFLLNVLTRHGREIRVADICGLRMEQLQPYTKQYGFTFIVRDSVFQADMEPGTVISQSPLPGSIVKKGRTFYLTVASTHPASEHMPDLTDLSVRQASALLETYGLKLGCVIEVPQPVKGSVVRQLYRGVEIEPGSPIMRGSAIDIEVGDGKDVWRKPVDSAAWDDMENVQETESNDYE